MTVTVTDIVPLIARQTDVMDHSDVADVELKLTCNVSFDPKRSYASSKQPASDRLQLVMRYTMQRVDDVMHHTHLLKPITPKS